MVHYKICIIGTMDMTTHLVQEMLNNNMSIDLIVGINETKVSQDIISSFSSLHSLAIKHNIPFFAVDSYSMQDAKTQTFFCENTFDLGICAGWQRLIPKNIIEKFKHGIFGFHGSCAYLPYGRGRSPLNWSLIKNDKRFILHMFKFDEFADSPNIFSKKMFEINNFDTIKSLYYKVSLCAFKLTQKLIAAYNTNFIKIQIENTDFEHFYLKRTPDDGKIDFTKRTQEIYNLIRAVTHPYPGAFAYINGNTKKTIYIWKAAPFDNMIDFSMHKIGSVMYVLDENLIIRTLDGSLMVTEYESTEKIEQNDFLS